MLSKVYLSYFSSLKRGDHLAAHGRKNILKYLHHGIYLGTSLEDGVPRMEIADFGSDSHGNVDKKVRKIDILKFKGNRSLFKFDYPEGTCNSSEAAAKLAEEAVDMPDIWGPYDVFTNNCEHFATKCKTGIPYSIQVENIKKVFDKATEAANSVKTLCLLL